PDVAITRGNPLDNKALVSLESREPVIPVSGSNRSLRAFGKNDLIGTRAALSWLEVALLTREAAMKPLVSDALWDHLAPIIPPDPHRSGQIRQQAPRPDRRHRHPAGGDGDGGQRQRGDPGVPRPDRHAARRRQARPRPTAARAAARRPGL